MNFELGGPISVIILFDHDVLALLWILLKVEVFRKNCCFLCVGFGYTDGKRLGGSVEQLPIE